MRSKSKDTYLFLAAYSILFIRAFLYTTAFDTLLPSYTAIVLRFAAYALFAARFMITMKSAKIKACLLGGIMLLFAVASKIKSSYGFGIDYALCCLCAIGIEFKSIVKTYVNISVFMTLLTVLACFTGLIEHYTYYRYDTFNNYYDTTQVRMSLGFVYPTDFAAHVYFTLAGILYLTYKKLKLTHGFFYFAIAAVTYLVTKSRGPSLMMCMTFGLCYICKFGEKHNIKIYPNWLLKYSPVFCAILTFIFVRGYTPTSKFWVQIDKFTSWRLSYGSKIMNDNKITLFGQFILEEGNGHGNEIVNDYTYIDLSFMRILLLYGAIFFVIVLVYSVLTNRKALNRNNYIIPTLLMAVSIYSMTAQHYLDFSYNIFLISLFTNYANEYKCMTFRYKRHKRLLFRRKKIKLGFSLALAKEKE